MTYFVQSSLKLSFYLLMNFKRKLMVSSVLCYYSMKRKSFYRLWLMIPKIFNISVFSIRRGCAEGKHCSGLKGLHLCHGNVSSLLQTQRVACAQTVKPVIYLFPWPAPHICHSCTVLLWILPGKRLLKRRQGKKCTCLFVKLCWTTWSATGKTLMNLSSTP